MGALLLTLLACNPYEGTWVLYAEVSKSPSDSDVGRDYSTSLELFALSDGSYAATLGSSPLVGTIENNELSLEDTSGYTYSAPNCDENTSTSTTSLEGEFDGQGGFSGKLKQVSKQETKGCGGDDSDSTTYEYTVTGVKLSANDPAHAGDLSFGY